jgi:hypothetical protein
LGFLAGGDEALAGTLASDALSPEVHLLVNELPVASTRAAGLSRSKVFSMNCADLLQFLGDGDVVKIISDAGSIELPGLGNAAMIYAGLPSRYFALQDKLREGHVFTKFGRLRPGHTDESKQAILDFYMEVSGLIEVRFGLPVFPCYGNLLGAIREGDFISHDVAGFDMMVICDGREPSDVKAEFLKICGLLLEQGYHLKLEPWGALIRRRHEDTTLLDLSFGWFTSADELHVAFGWRHTPARGRQRLLAHRICTVAERSVRVPGNAEEVLEQLYGLGWGVPDQGYSAHVDLKRDACYLVTDAEMRVLLARHPGRVQLSEQKERVAEEY